MAITAYNLNKQDNKRKPLLPIFKRDRKKRTEGQNKLIYMYNRVESDSNAVFYYQLLKTFAFKYTKMFM